MPSRVRIWLVGVLAVLGGATALWVSGRDGPPALPLSVSDQLNIDASTMIRHSHAGPAGPLLWARRCRNVMRRPLPAQRRALDRVVRMARTQGDRRLTVNAGLPPPSVHDVASGVAADIALCRARVDGVPPEWTGIESLLRAAAAG